MIHIYGTSTCPWCDKAKEFLKSKGYPYSFHNIETNMEARQEYSHYFPGKRTVPQIIRFYPSQPDGDTDVSYHAIGGYEDLVAYLK